MTSLSTQLDINALVEMGFSKERVEVAIKSLTNPDIQSVVEWLFNHPVPDNNAGHRLGGGEAGGGETASKTPVENASMEADGAVPSENVDNTAHAGEEGVSGGDAPQQALSLKCEDCGKQIRSELDAQTHAARTGHQNFAESTEEIKPLTAEEKEAQKQRLQQKLEERRKERERAEKEQEKAREKTRRVTGKEVTQAREEQAYKEMKRLAEERRKEKLEEKRLKQKVKDEIAKDRAALKKTASPSAATAAPSKETKATEDSTSSKAVDAPVKKEYTSSRIQFRLADGSTQNSNFNAEDRLQVVIDHVSEKLLNYSPFELSTTFPRKVFGTADSAKTLKELGLVPSAALVVKNRL